MVSLSIFQHNLWRWDPLSPDSGSSASRCFATAASLHACHHVSRQLRLDFHLRSSLKKLQKFSDDARLEFSRCQRLILFNGARFLQSPANIVFSRSSSSVCFFNGGESRIDPRGEEGSSSNQETSKRNTLNGRRWTNVLLAINVIMYIAQVASNGKVLTWGAKINCYSLNSIGPTAESLGGPKRFLAVYLTSAVASSAMSYLFNKAPSVGASGAIFGLVGSVAVFVMRHKKMVRGGNEDLRQIAQVIALNMTLGLLSRGIDNWGHIGGLLGGTTMAWLVGPQWKYEYTTRDGLRVFMDSAPIPLLLRWRNEQRRL